MKLKDINRTVINTSKIPLINDSALNIQEKKLLITLDDIRYCFCYLEEQDLLDDYNAIYAKIEDM